MLPKEYIPGNVEGETHKEQAARIAETMNGWVLSVANDLYELHDPAARKRRDSLALHEKNKPKKLRKLVVRSVAVGQRGERRDMLLIFNPAGKAESKTALWFDGVYGTEEGSEEGFGFVTCKKGVWEGEYGYEQHEGEGYGAPQTSYFGFRPFGHDGSVVRNAQVQLRLEQSLSTAAIVLPPKYTYDSSVGLRSGLVVSARDLYGLAVREEEIPDSSKTPPLYIRNDLGTWEGIARYLEDPSPLYYRYIKGKTAMYTRDFYEYFRSLALLNHVYRNAS